MLSQLFRSSCPPPCWDIICWSYSAADRRWGVMTALRGQRIELVPLEEAVAELRTVPVEDYEAAAAFFG